MNWIELNWTHTKHRLHALLIGGSGVFVCNIFSPLIDFFSSVFLYILLYIPTSLLCKQSFKLDTGTIFIFLLVHFVSIVSEINQFKKKKKRSHLHYGRSLTWCMLLLVSFFGQEVGTFWRVSTVTRVPLHQFSFKA